MPSTRGAGSHDAAGEGRARVAAALRTLDPFSFWVMPLPDARSDDLIVAGTTGIFLVMPSSLSGVLQFGMTGAAIGTQKVADVGGLKRRAKALQAKLGRAAVYEGVEPVVCLTHALTDCRTVRGVRYVPVKDLAKDLSGRSGSVPRGRAQRAARALGMHIVGDERRHFTPS
jgi:hypothetical protein